MADHPDDCVIPSSWDIPEDERFIGFDFVDPDNDYVVSSRLGCLVDLGSSVRVGLGPTGLLGAREVDDPLDSEQVFDSEKSDYGNAGIARLDVLSDGYSW